MTPARSALLVLAMVACKDREPASREPAPEKPRCGPPGATVCVGNEVATCLASGELGARVRCPGRCSAGSCLDTCAVRDIELIYVVDHADNLSSFDPRKLPGDPFHRIAKLDCEPDTTPFSMSVDRMGIAWILYRSGTLYRASIIDGKCLPGSTAVGAPTLFGMGFVSDGPDATTEKLFVAAFDGPDVAHLDLAPPRPVWKLRGKLPDAGMNPELTGTGAGKLYGFFPMDGGFVQELDPATARPVGARLAVGAPRGRVGGWAFAHWGGKFYVFVTIEATSMVFEVDAKTGESRRVLDRLPNRIVGAGVSTCAPLLERPAQ